MELRERALFDKKQRLRAAMQAGKVRKSVRVVVVFTGDESDDDDDTSPSSHFAQLRRNDVFALTVESSC